MTKPRVVIEMDPEQAALLGELLGQVHMHRLGDYPRQFVDLHKALTGRPTICGSITVRSYGEPTEDHSRHGRFLMPVGTFIDMREGS